MDAEGADELVGVGVSKGDVGLLLGAGAGAWVDSGEVVMVAAGAWGCSAFQMRKATQANPNSMDTRVNQPGVSVPDRAIAICFAIGLGSFAIALIVSAELVSPTSCTATNRSQAVMTGIRLRGVRWRTPLIGVCCSPQ